MGFNNQKNREEGVIFTHRYNNWRYINKVQRSVLEFSEEEGLLNSKSKNNNKNQNNSKDNKQENFFKQTNNIPFRILNSKPQINLKT